MESPGRRIHDVTSIGRHIDPSHPTNRAVLALLPLAAIVAGAVAAAGGAGTGAAALSAGGGALAAFGAWALAREIAPDDEIGGAFLSMALGFAAFLRFDVALAPVFAALFYTRVVNRSTGLAATGLDSMLVSVFALFTAWRTGSPWPAAAGAFAFALDAVLSPGLARQWLFAGLCAGGAVAMTTAGLTPDVVPVQPGLIPRTVATVVAVGTLAFILSTRRVTARGDATGAPLSVARVRGAQVATLLTAFAVAAAGTGGVISGGVLWATLAGVTASAAIREVWPGRRSSTRD